MQEKQTGTAYFKHQARRLSELEDYRTECIRRGKKPQRYVVEKVIALSKIEYENVSFDLLMPRQFIADNIPLMTVDANNFLHCLLVVQKGNEDIGILIECRKKQVPTCTALYKKQGFKLAE
ncbi:MAG: hypothetical protein Q8873_09540 [Bacillota bacterium]|nr:hypothetical protein [Bacillota bacterium]